MSTEAALIISGFLFWFIIATNIASGRFGYQTINEPGPEAKLKQIKDNPANFKISVILILVEHISIIALAATLFVAFSSYSLILAVTWTVSRSVESLIQIYHKRDYWRLLNLAHRYSGVGTGNNDELINQASTILKSKSSHFSLSQVFFSIGTLAYSILFVWYGVLPLIIGWSGIIASSLYGLGNSLTPVKTKFKIILYPGALLVLIFEAVLGGWLLFVHNVS
jgi:hypothetical protein